MIVIGITGGIGAGKSKASRYIAEKGYVLIDADQIGHDMTADGRPLLVKLNKLFGPDGTFGVKGHEILVKSTSAEGEYALKRQALADLVFNDKKKKDAFDALMHKEITATIDRNIMEIKEGTCGNVKGILLDAPLLFEAGIDNRCDSVVVVTADENIRIQRIMNRDGLTEEQIKDRMRNQMDDSDKIKKADYVIDNSGDYETLKQKLDHVLENFG